MVAPTGIDLVKPDSVVTCLLFWLSSRGFGFGAPCFDQRISGVGGVYVPEAQPNRAAWNCRVQIVDGVLVSKGQYKRFSVVTSIQEGVLLTMLRLSRDDPFSGVDHLLSPFPQPETTWGTDHLPYEARATCGFLGSTEVNIVGICNSCSLPRLQEKADSAWCGLRGRGVSPTAPSIQPH